MAAIPGTILAAKISPGDTAATFPTHVDIYGQGGLMSVADIAELQAIPLARQKVGMLVYVQNLNTYYALSGTSSPLTTFTAYSDLSGSRGLREYTHANFLPLTGGSVSSLNITDRFVVEDQLYYTTDNQVTQLSALSGNYDEGQFLGNVKLSQNNTRLVNVGNTWTAKESNRGWYSIAMSSDGKYQSAVVTGGQIYVSNDYGHTWTAKDSNRDWQEIAMSSDGKYQSTTVGGNGQIYVSNDYGNTWTAKDSNRSWIGIAMSSDGKYQSATVAGNGQIYVSNDYGHTWTAKASNRSWTIIAMSSDGKYQSAAVENGGQIYVSNDYGHTWTAKASNSSWYSVAMSSDGKYQSAVANGGQIYISVADELIAGNLSVNGAISGNNVTTNALTVVGNISATGTINADSVVVNSIMVPVSVIQLVADYTFISTDTNNVFHFNTTSNSLTAIFPSSLPVGFNVSVMNTGTNKLHLSAASLKSLGSVLNDQYSGAFVYRAGVSDIFAIGGL